MSKRLAVILMAMTCAGSAFAGTSAADTCSAQLSSTGKYMYALAAPNLNANEDVQTTLRNAVAPQVGAGNMTKQEARSEGRAVLRCLELQRSAITS